MSTTPIMFPEFGIELDFNHSPQEFKKIFQSLSPEQQDNLTKEIRSRAANKVLEQYDTKTTSYGAIPTGLGYTSSTPLYNIERVEKARELIGRGRPETGDYAGKQIPKEVLIAASLGIPEENVDLSKGLPAATRTWANLSAVEEEKEKYLEIASGGELKKIDINGVNQLFVFNPDGTLNPIDEKGLSIADFTELIDYAPEVAGITAEVGLVATVGPSALPVAFVAGPAVETIVQESANKYFREFALNPALEKAEQGTVNLYDGSLKRGAKTFALGLAGNAVGNLGGRLLLKSGAVDYVTPNQLSIRTAKVMSDLQKVASKKGIDLRLPDIPFGDATMNIVQSTDSGQLFLTGMMKRLQDFQKHISDPEYLIKNKEIFDKELEELAIDQVQLARYLDAEISAVDLNAATALGDAIKRDVQEIQNLKASNGEYSFSQDDLLTTSNPFNESLIGLKDRISEISDKNYQAVRTSFRNNPPKKPIKAQDFFSRMEKKLSLEEMNQFAELYATEIKRTPTLEIVGKTAYEDLKKSSNFSSANMNFDSLNKLYRLRKEINFKEGKQLEATNFYKALKQERLNSLDSQGKKLLTEADSYYNKSVDPMRERILGPAFDKFTDISGRRGVKPHEGLAGVDNVLKNDSGAAVEKFDLAIKLFDEAKDEAGKLQYIKSLRGAYLFKNGAFNGKPSGRIYKPTEADRLLQKKLFGNQYEGMFGLLTELHNLGGSIGPDVGRYILDNASKLSKKESELLYDQLKVISKEKIQKQKDLGEFLFNSTDQITLLKNQGKLAEFVTNQKVSGPAIEEFLSKFSSDLQRDAFKARVIEELFANNQKSGYLFDGKKVIELLKTNDDKYKTLFGAKKLSNIKKYADVVSRIPQVDAKLSKKATELGNSNLALTADGGKVRFYYRWLSGLGSDPQKSAKILGIHLQSIGEGAEKHLNRSVLEMNPDYLIDQILVGKVMSRTLATDSAIKILFSQNDPTAASLRNDLAIYSSTISADERSKSPEAILGPE